MGVKGRKSPGSGGGNPWEKVKADVAYWRLRAERAEAGLMYLLKTLETAVDDTAKLALTETERDSSLTADRDGRGPARPQ